MKPVDCSFMSVRCADGGVRQRRKSWQAGGNAVRCRRKTEPWMSNSGGTNVGRRPRGIPLIVVSGEILGHSTRNTTSSRDSVTVPRIIDLSVRTRVAGLAQAVSGELEGFVGTDTEWSKQSMSNSANSG